MWNYLDLERLHRFVLRGAVAIAGVGGPGGGERRNGLSDGVGRGRGEKIGGNRQNLKIA